MELLLKRIAKQKDYTIGRLSIDGIFFCNTLEPKWCDYQNGECKVEGHSAIPEGRYPVLISYSPQFGMWLPILLWVPMFKGIRIHAGNTVEDTRGCILVGDNLQKGMLLNSRVTLYRLIEKITEVKEKGEGVWITVE